jgi:hypothetical protein
MDIKKAAKEANKNMVWFFVDGEKDVYFFIV